MHNNAGNNATVNARILHGNSLGLSANIFSYDRINATTAMYTRTPAHAVRSESTHKLTHACRTLTEVHAHTYARTSGRKGGLACVISIHIAHSLPISSATANLGVDGTRIRWLGIWCSSDCVVLRVVLLIVLSRFVAGCLNACCLSFAFLRGPNSRSDDMSMQIN